MADKAVDDIVEERPSQTMAYGAALDRLRADPGFADLIRDSYLGPDPLEEARRFEASAEWRETTRLVSPWLIGGRIVDLGAGTGLSSYAMAKAGAREVLAIEPWTGAGAGRDAIVGLGIPTIQAIDAHGEDLPLADASVDLVYARQTLHHADNLADMLSEVARVLRPGGAMFSCRDHVVDGAEQLARFLAGHPVHQLAGGENAYRLDEYLEAMAGAGLTVQRTLGPRDSIVNAFPAARSAAELEILPRIRLERRFGTVGSLLARLPGVSALVWRRWRSEPGRLYSFLAVRSAEPISRY